MFLSMFLSDKQIHSVDPPPRTTPLLQQSAAFLFQLRLITQKRLWQLPLDTALCWMPGLLNPMNTVSEFINSFYSKILPSCFLIKGACEGVNSLNHWMFEELYSLAEWHVGWVQVSSYTRSIFHFFFPDFLVFSLFSLGSSLFSFYGILIQYYQRAEYSVAIFQA